MWRKLPPKRNWRSIFLHSCNSRSYHFSSSVAAASKNSINWVSENKLFQKYPRLHFLEEQCRSLDQLKQVLSYIFVSSLHRNPFIMSRVLYLCIFALDSEDGDVKRGYGALVFRQIDKPNIFSWNTMIRAFATSGDSCNAAIAFHYYFEMLRRGTLPDKYTCHFLIQACGSISDLGLGKQVQCHAVTLGFALDLFVQNALLHVYLICGSLVDAWKLFDEMSERDVVSWTTLISGLVLQGYHTDSLFVFNRMLIDELKIRPNVATVVSVMSACADLGSLDLTKCLHANLIKAGFSEVDVSISNSLIDAYAKCGSIDCAEKVFHEVHGLRRDIYSWTTMIAGLSMHGRGREATTLFPQMNRVDGVVPDAITFIAVLSACAHSGLVEEGKRIFESMEEDFGIAPEVKHYGCMVDLFGRAGLLEHAYNFVEGMPIKPNLAILGSLLSACRVHNNVKLGEVVLKKIESSCENGGGAHVLLSNIYANENRWSKVIHIREEIKGGEKKQEKPPGRSWIEVKGLVHEFVVGDRLHPQAMELYMALDGLGRL
ncbi:hypothetical protein HHK36_024356 [Tetracentron sinense]|uniref:Pentatricopeptide repeat-containing protein n=1 Tax=Tetracentron sinense TaxID=13715 RepID=A0A835D6M3_TETSI|nr:hypothetical protein HHK36_024356 [Tetracentron sinense]